MSRTGARTQTVRRGAAPARSRGAAKRATRRPLGPRLLERQPLPPHVVRRIMVTLLTLLFIAALIGLAVVTGAAAFVRDEAVAAVGRAGFSVKRIEVVGANRLDRLKVYDVALRQKDRSMAAFDLEEVRRELLADGWVADARVSRRLPDTLVIDLVERSPVAVWQRAGGHVLIDASGRPLPDVAPGAVPGLPVLVSDQPARDLAAYQRLTAAAPALREQITGGAWVGERRWNISFRSGETLLLPEGEARAKDALTEFAQMDGTSRLLGRGITRFDMRVPGRLVYRPTREGDLGDLGLVTGSDRAVVPAAKGEN